MFAIVLSVTYYHLFVFDCYDFLLQRSEGGGLGIGQAGSGGGLEIIYLQEVHRIY